MSSPAHPLARRLGLLAITAALLTFPSAAAAASPLLGPPTYYSVPGQDAAGIVAGKLDSGSTRDLAVADINTSAATVFLGSGSGAFGRPTTYPGFHKGHPRRLAAGDVNGDRQSDILLADHLKGDMSVLLGFAGGFRPPTVTGVPCNPYALKIGNLDGDAHPDVAAACNGEFSSVDHRVVVLPGHGDGTFGPSSSLETGGRAYGVAIVDLNRDGLADLVTAETTDSSDDPEGGVAGVSVFLGTGGGTFAARSSFSAGSLEPTSVATGDLNEDGRQDVVAGGGPVAVLLNDGHGGLRAPVDYASAGGDVALADLDGDGHLDVLTAGLSVLRGRGDGTLEPASDFIGGGGSLALADFNWDGRIDVATNAGGNVAVRLNTGGPAITGVAPSSGPVAGGTRVTVTGWRFTGVGTVRFGDTPASSFSVLDDRHITAVVPPGSRGVANVRVISPYGISSKSAADHFTYVTSAGRAQSG